MLGAAYATLVDDFSDYLSLAIFLQASVQVLGHLLLKRQDTQS
jgi:hypothetical protein